MPDMNCHSRAYVSMLECSKKPAVDPPATAPYLISFWLARSSAELMGLSSVSTVRKAARLAVYEEIMISAKKNHIPAANLTHRAMGATSEPCCMSAPSVNQNELSRVYWFSYSSGSLIQLGGSSHWLGENRART